MTPSLFDATPPPAPSLFPDSPACPEVFTVRRIGASWSVLDNAGLLICAYAAGSETKARAFCADLQAAFSSGWYARDAALAAPVTPGQARDVSKREGYKP